MILVKKSNNPVTNSIIPTILIFPTNNKSIWSLKVNPIIPAGMIAIIILIMYFLLFSDFFEKTPKNNSKILFYKMKKNNVY